MSAVEYRPWPVNPRYLVGSDGSVIGLFGRKLKAKPLHGGYPSISVQVPGKPQGFARVHVMVCETFHGERPTPKHQVAHSDGNPENNAVDNLRWATPSENNTDTYRHQRLPVGEQHHTAKLNTDKVIAIRARYLAGERYQDLAKEYGVYPNTITDVLKAKTWKHVPGYEMAADHYVKELHS